jgi:anti-anti-sigma regulatory factor
VTDRILRRPSPADGIEKLDLEGEIDVHLHGRLVRSFGEIFAGKEHVRLVVGLERAEHISMMPFRALAAARDACDGFVLVGMNEKVREVLTALGTTVGRFEIVATTPDALKLLAGASKKPKTRRKGDGGDARERFIRALLERDPGDPVAAEYAESLSPSAAEAGAEAAARGLVKCLGDEDADEDAIVESLVGIGAPAVPALLEALDDDETSFAAADALGRIGEPAIRPLLDSLLRNGAGPALDPLVEMGEPVGAHLLAVVNEAPADKLRELPRELVDSLTPRLEVLEAIVGRLIADKGLGDSLLDEVIVSLATRLGVPAIPSLCRLVRDGPLDPMGDVVGCFEKIEGLGKEDARRAVEALRARLAKDPEADTEQLEGVIAKLEKRA